MDTSMLNKGMEQLKADFNNPGHEWRGKPFWSWNGELTAEELKRQVDVLKDMGFGGYFMHSRAGLITEYLGEEWFKFTNEVADYGEKLNLESYLYDEDRWPSGSAGGIVTREKKYRGKEIIVTESDPDKYNPEQLDPDLKILGVYALELDDKKKLLSYEKIPEGPIDPKAYEGKRIVKYDVCYFKPSSTYNGTTYIDTMRTEATEKFIELTHEKYVEECGDRIGNSITAIFTDEPNRGELLGRTQVDADGTIRDKICYTDDIFDEFEKRYGYSALDILPELFYTCDNKMSKKVKKDYIDLACNLFVERFAKPINDWCKAHNMDFTGHVLHEDSLMSQTCPNGSLMRFYTEMGAPGIDNLSEWSNAFWAAKQLASEARQRGQKWLLSELYGCTGWQFNFRSHKAVGDWQALLGINLRCPHLSWYTMEGESKRDYPASILHQSAWYKEYNTVETYFARFGRIMTEGAPVCDVLVINSIESVWTKMHIGWANWIFCNDESVGKIEKAYVDLFNNLQGSQIDFDYGEEYLMEGDSEVVVENGVPLLRVGLMKYRVVVISGMDTIRSTTMKLIEKFAKAGGKVILSGILPDNTDAGVGEIPGIKCIEGKYANVETVEFEACALANAIKSKLSVRLDYSASDFDTRALLCQPRILKEDGDAFVLATINTDREKAADNVTMKITGISGYVQVQEWNMLTGERTDITGTKASINGDNITIVDDFYPAGEHMYIIVKTKEEGLKVSGKTAKTVKTAQFTKNVKYKLSEKNVLVLDFVHGNFEGHDIPEMEVLKFDRAVRDIIGIEHRGGNMLQPWYAKKYENKPYGNATWTYTFVIEDMPENDLVLAGERPEFITYSVNGHELEADGGFWVDSAFKTMKLPKAYLKPGKNEVVAKTVFRRTTNIEACYILGDFGVKLEAHEQNITRSLNAKGRFFGNEKIMVKLPETVGFENIAEYNLPFYTGAITYIIPANELPELQKGERLVLKGDNFVGTVMKVGSVDDVEAGKGTPITWEPYEADITDVKGDLAVKLVCNRKNTFGPLHQVPCIPGATGPESFTTGGDGFSEDYVLMDSGIFEGIKFEIKKD